jgi:hypothetical protein
LLLVAHLSFDIIVFRDKKHKRFNAGILIIIPTTSSKRGDHNC